MPRYCYKGRSVRKLEYEEYKVEDLFQALCA